MLIVSHLLYFPLEKVMDCLSLCPLGNRERGNTLGDWQFALFFKSSNDQGNIIAQIKSYKVLFWWWSWCSLNCIFLGYLGSMPVNICGPILPQTKTAGSSIVHTLLKQHIILATLVIKENWKSIMKTLFQYVLYYTFEPFSSFNPMIKLEI